MVQQQLAPQTRVGQSQFDPWMAALAAGLSAPAVPAVQPGNTGGSGAGLEPQQSAWKDYAPTSPAPRYTPQPQGMRSDDVQSVLGAYFGPSYGADQGTRQRNAAQAAADYEARHRQQWDYKSYDDGYRPSKDSPFDSEHNYKANYERPFSGPGATDADKSVTGITANFFLTQTKKSPITTCTCTAAGLEARGPGSLNATT